MSFKVGDKVKCIHTGPEVVDGQVYTVCKVSQGRGVIWLTGVVRDHWASDFRLASAPSALAIGQKVHEDIAKKVDQEILKSWQKVHEAATAKQTPQIQCSICYTKAPRVLVPYPPRPGNLLGMDTMAWQNDLNGWMVATFPFKDQYIEPRREGMESLRFGALWPEVAKLCPTCGLKVRSYMAFLADKGVTEHDL